MITRPSADRASSSSPMPPIAYRPTHFEASARPEQQPDADERHHDHPWPSPAPEPQIAANNVTAAVVNSVT